MVATESIPEDDDLKVFLEAVVEYLRTIDSKTGRPERGNREAKQGLNSCKSITGILPFDTDIHYNISRIEKILEYLDPRIRNKHTLHDIVTRARRELKLYREQKAEPHPIPQRGLGREEVEIPLTTREVLRGRYADFRDIYRDAVESVRSQVQREVKPEIFENRLNRLGTKIKEEFTGGIDGLKIYFDAKHSELLYASQGAPAEEQRDFLLRVAKIFIGAFARNNFYELHKRISSKGAEDVDSFVFRLAKKYTDIKALKPEAGITTYQDGGGNIQLKEK
jgi:hypothetical protein